MEKKAAQDSLGASHPGFLNLRPVQDELTEVDDHLELSLPHYPEDNDKSEELEPRSISAVKHLPDTMIGNLDLQLIEESPYETNLLKPNPAKSNMELFRPKLVNFIAEDLLNEKEPKSTKKQPAPFKIQSLEKLAEWQKPIRSEISTTMMSTSCNGWRSPSGKRPNRGGPSRLLEGSPTASARSEKPHLFRLFSCSSLPVEQPHQDLRSDPEAKNLVLKVNRIPSSERAEGEWTTRLVSISLKPDVLDQKEDVVFMKKKSVLAANMRGSQPVIPENKKIAKQSKRLDQKLIKRNKSQDPVHHAQAESSTFVGLMPRSSTSTTKSTKGFKLVELRELDQNLAPCRKAENWMIPTLVKDPLRRGHLGREKNNLQSLGNDAEGGNASKHPKALESRRKSGVRPLLHPFSPKNRDHPQHPQTPNARTTQDPKSSIKPEDKTVTHFTTVPKTPEIIVEGEAFIKVPLADKLAKENRLFREQWAARVEHFKFVSNNKSRQFRFGGTPSEKSAPAEQFVRAYPIVVDKSQKQTPSENIVNDQELELITTMNGGQMRLSSDIGAEAIHPKKKSEGFLIGSSKGLTTQRIVATNTLWLQHESSLARLLDTPRTSQTSKKLLHPRSSGSQTKLHSKSEKRVVVTHTADVAHQKNTLKKSFAAEASLAGENGVKTPHFRSLVQSPRSQNHSGQKADISFGRISQPGLASGLENFKLFRAPSNLYSGAVTSRNC